MTTPDMRPIPATQAALGPIAGEIDRLWPGATVTGSLARFDIHTDAGAVGWCNPLTQTVYGNYRHPEDGKMMERRMHPPHEYPEFADTDYLGMQEDAATARAAANGYTARVSRRNNDVHRFLYPRPHEMGPKNIINFEVDNGRVNEAYRAGDMWR